MWQFPGPQYGPQCSPSDARDPQKSALILGRPLYSYVIHFPVSVSSFGLSSESSLCTGV